MSEDDRVRDVARLRLGKRGGGGGGGGAGETGEASVTASHPQNAVPACLPDNHKHHRVSRTRIFCS